jgi:predicted AlkP superfamily phosphohydrolase/phosphomutase
MPRTLVLGLDCLSPELVAAWWEHLPHLSGLEKRGVSGRLSTTHPPITVPAWRAIFSGKDPGELGVYGFRNRRQYRTAEFGLADSGQFVAEPIWAEWTRRGETTAILNIPGTFPCQGLATWEISCLRTPSDTAGRCHPAGLLAELTPCVEEADYPFDVADYRRLPALELAERVTQQTRDRFAVLRHIWATKHPAHCLFVDLGCDRMHHRFWNEGLFAPSNLSSDSSTLRKFYQFLDEQVGLTLGLVDWAETRVMVLSDHGAVACHGGFRLNQWLEEQGWLRRLPEHASAPDFHHGQIDWAGTKAWAEGGYYGRVFLNVQGREGTGVIPPEDYEKTRSILRHMLRQITCPGSSSPLLVERPEEVYRSVNNVAPDLFVYDPDLHWRFLAGFGADNDLWPRTDAGLDRANHSWHGYFSAWDPTGKYPLMREGVVDYREIHPWLLGESNEELRQPSAVNSRLASVEISGSPEVEKRLRDLGYLG